MKYLVCGLLMLAGLPASAEQVAQRVVSAGGSISEWVVALGAQERLVGVDTTSLNPPALRQLPSVGYQRQLSAEGVLALRPQLVLGSEEMGPPPVLEQLQAAGVRVERLSAQPSEAALDDTLTRLGMLLGARGKAAQLAKDFHAALQQRSAWIRQARGDGRAPGVLLVLSHAGGSTLVGGRDTAAEWLIRRAGGRNLATHDGYKPLSAEALTGLDADVLIVSDRSLGEAAAREALLSAQPALAHGRAACEGRILGLDPTLLVGGLGPRIPQALEWLSQRFYPSAETVEQDPR